jgi:hypothetical protein
LAVSTVLRKRRGVDGNGAEDAILGDARPMST